MPRFSIWILSWVLIGSAAATSEADVIDRRGHDIAREVGRIVGLPDPDAFAPGGARLLRVAASSVPPDASDELRFSVAVYQLVRAAIAQRQPEIDNESRWLVEGLTYVLVEDAVQRELGDPAANRFRAGLEAPPQKAISQASNLAYWAPGIELLPALNARERELNAARVAFAYHESREALGDRSIETIGDIFGPTERRALVDHASDITGTDLRERVRSYQSFETTEEGRQKTLQRLKLARESDRHDQAVSHAVRLMEIERDFSPKRYALLAALLHEADRDHDALILLDKRAEKTTDLEARTELLATLMDYADRWGRVDIAYATAERVLAETPDDLMALSLRMQRQRGLGKLIQAKVTAQHIVALNPNDAEAQRVIEAVNASVGVPSQAEP